MACPLPYPERFQAAAKFWKLQPAGIKKHSQEHQLLLYALNQQATVGPNTTPKPWGWTNVVESTKWQGWKELGKMSTIEAMRLFVKTLDEEQSDWWTLLQRAEESGAAASGEAAPAEGPAAPAPGRPLADEAQLGVWTQLEAGPGAGKEGGRKPLPRYEAGAALVDGRVYVLGGNYGGRYLADCWALSLAEGTWSQVHLQPTAEGGSANGAAATASSSAFPPTAGHTVTAYGGKLYVLGGHTKAKSAASMALRVIDPASRTLEAPAVSGTPPAARGGHTATLLGSRLWVFGGEDAGRKALADVHVLDLATLTWSQPQVKGKAPLPRSACCAAAFQDRYVLVFGGGSVATVFNDLHVLDTEGLTWSQPAQAGARITPRAGHSGAVLGDVWYIVGGGNNVKGCADLLAADLGQLGTSGTVTWHVVASVALREPLSSEGISLVADPRSRLLLAFGGYNGKYQGVVSLFRAPEGPAALLGGAAAAAATAVEAAKGAAAPQTAAAPAAKVAEAAPAAAAAPPAAASKASSSMNLQAAAAPGPAAPATPDPSAVVSELRGQLDAARRDAESAIREAAAAKEGAAHELALMRKQLTGAQAALAEANKALDDARGALASEQSKVLKLEAQAAEMQAKLGQVAELQKEVDKLRRERAAREAEAEAAAKKGGGLWGYLAGSGGSSS